MNAAKTKLTPMMRQYQRMKSEIDSDVILMFRLGDFYELFFDDARRAAPVLGVTLTQRGGVPMCGVPYHALDSYLAKLIRAQCKVAICEQMEDPATAKGIVRRDIARIITPGTVVEDGLLTSDEHAFLAALCYADRKYGLALLDLSTGTFILEELETPAALRDSLRRSRPRECLLPEVEAAGADDSQSLERLVTEGGIACITRTDEWRFEYETARNELLRHFGVTSLDGYGAESLGAAVGAAGALLQHVRDGLRRSVEHVRSMRFSRPDGFLLLEEASYAHLDLLPAHGKAPDTTLFGVLDTTCTAMGARRLQSWIAQPLCNAAAIAARHDAIDAFINRRAALAAVRQQLKDVRDLDRLISRISLGRGNPRELMAVATSLQKIPDLRDTLGEMECARVDESSLLGAMLTGGLQPLPELTERVLSTLVEDAPANTAEGGIIRAGVSAELDELRALAADGRAWVGRYQAQQAERTGIKTLKVRHNKVFGYFIEVSSAHASKVPEDYQRRQTMVNCERFVTPELKEYEEKIFGAHDRAVEMELEILAGLREVVVAEMATIQKSSDSIATLDTLAALADRALALGYTRPDITDSDCIQITEGRHPIIEQLPEAERFVPNDTLLDGAGNQILIITGPNMAGKSTYIRQVAMIVVMAQMGSFVPADSARIGLVDRVFTRVGASDDIARGRSTFMVEMQETANILHNATARSLVVLDEIGRGTSTYDGISIAWAVAEQLHNNPATKARTLFATHYHELTDLALTLDGVKNYCVQVREQRSGIAFLRRIVPGAADKSYGIAVAQLAGMPAAVVDRAKEILANLEEGELAESGQPKLARTRRKPASGDGPQMMLFPNLL